MGRMSEQQGACTIVMRQSRQEIFIALRRFLRHLRLHFQFVLAPVFLLGYDLSGASPDFSFLALFCLIHIGLYGGATAYNSYYDRDAGPIGGMRHPPTVGPLELYGGLGLQLIALTCLAFWGRYMFVAGLAMFLMGIAYSHPRWRWKARPLGSLLTVTIGQGLVPFFMGLGAVPSMLGEADIWDVILTACAAALIITGLYPLTQVYQIDEDQQRGDRSFAVYYGPQYVFVISRMLVGAGVVLMQCVLLRGESFHSFWKWLLPLGYAVFWGVVHRWSKRFAQQTVYQNHDRAFGISMGMSSVFWFFLLVEFMSRFLH